MKLFYQRFLSYPSTISLCSSIAATPVFLHRSNSSSETLPEVTKQACFTWKLVQVTCHGRWWIHELFTKDASSLSLWREMFSQKPAYFSTKWCLRFTVNNWKTTFLDKMAKTWCRACRRKPGVSFVCVCVSVYCYEKQQEKGSRPVPKSSHT